MTAISIQVSTLQIQNPDFDRQSEPQWTELPSGITFQQQVSSSLITLSSTGANGDDDISGLLYFPALSDAQLQECPQANDTSIIPRNVTTRSDLPPEYPLIALAPWFPNQHNCTFAFMSVARTPMIVYHPGSSSSVPRADDDSWALDGHDWTRTFRYPVWAVSGEVGTGWMQQLSAYSGNATEVPEGDDLLENGLVEASDYIRLMADVSTGGGTGLPSLWVFLLMVVAILIIIIGTTSSVMHCIARARRRMLRRRVINGEVDLEALGIKRLRVPQEVLDKMPKYEYIGPPASAAPSPTIDKEDPITSASAASQAAPASSTPPPMSHFHQQTCAICLDDFVSAASIASRKASGPRRSASIKQPKVEADVAEDAVGSDARSIRSTASQDTPSIVRELPCGHIFHADCVDPFLTSHSSLCPLCKKSSLPMGFVPRTITNTMVRRERQMRALRGSTTGDPAINSAAGTHTFMTPMQRILNAGRRTGDRHGAARRGAPASTQGRELQDMGEQQAQTPAAPQSGTAETGTAIRTATTNDVLAEAREAQATRPQRTRPPWHRRVVRSLFPVA